MPTQKAASKKSSALGAQPETDDAQSLPAIDAGALLKKRINQHFDDNKEALIARLAALTGELVRQPTVNVPANRLSEYPYMDIPGQESRVTEILERELDTTKLEYKKYERTKGRPNLIASVGKGRKKLMVACRLDVPPPGDGWKGNPFEPVVEGGCIQGRGVLDNKGPLIAALLAAEALKPIERQLKGQLLVAGFADTLSIPGKGRKDCGIDYLMEEGLVKPDFAIVPASGGDLQKITVAEKGQLIIHVKALGKQTHGALTAQGDNAILRMANLLSKLNSISMPFKTHKLMGKPTINVGFIRGGHCADMIPGECEALLDARYLPDQRPESIIEALKKVAAGMSDAKFRFKEVYRSPPVEIDADNILVRSVQANIALSLGIEAPTVGTGIDTLTRDLLQGGTIAIGYGPGRQSLYRSAAEQANLSQLLEFARIITQVTIDLFT